MKYRDHVIWRKMVIKELKFRQQEADNGRLDLSMVIKVLEHPRKFPDFINNSRAMVVVHEKRMKEFNKRAKENKLWLKNHPET